MKLDLVVTDVEAFDVTREIITKNLVENTKEN